MKAKYTLTVEAIDNSGETMARASVTVTANGVLLRQDERLADETLATTKGAAETIAQALWWATKGRGEATLDGPILEHPTTPQS